MRQVFMSIAKGLTTSRGMNACRNERSTWASWHM
jgi:hypothetical protein